MTILGGVGFLAITSLLFGWAYGALRRPNPKHWAESEGVATAICLAVTLLLAVTLGLFTQATLDSTAQLAELGVGQKLMAVAVLVAGLFGFRLLSAPARRAVPDTAAEAVFPVQFPGAPLSAANDNSTNAFRAA